MVGILRKWFASLDVMNNVDDWGEERAHLVTWPVLLRSDPLQVLDGPSLRCPMSKASTCPRMIPRSRPFFLKVHKTTKHKLLSGQDSVFANVGSELSTLLLYRVSMSAGRGRASPSRLDPLNAASGELISLELRKEYRFWMQQIPLVSLNSVASMGLACGCST